MVIFVFSFFKQCPVFLRTMFTIFLEYKKIINRFWNTNKGNLDYFTVRLTGYYKFGPLITNQTKTNSVVAGGAWQKFSGRTVHTDISGLKLICIKDLYLHTPVKPTCTASSVLLISEPQVSLALPGQAGTGRWRRPQTAQSLHIPVGGRAAAGYRLRQSGLGWLLQLANWSGLGGSKQGINQIICVRSIGWTSSFT